MMNRRRLAQGYGLSVAVLMVVGLSAACTPDASDASAPPTVNATTIPEETESDPAEADMTWADGRLVELFGLSMNQIESAGDGDVEETQTLLGEWENEQVIPMAMGPDDQILVTVVPEDNFDSATDGMKKHERVGILQGEDVTILDTFRPSDVPRQTLSGDISQGYAAWLETPSTQAGASDWLLWAQDLTSADDPVLVTTSEDAAGDDEPPMLGESALAISGDRVFWHTNPELDDGLFGHKVMSAALTGGDVRVEVEFGAAPVAIEGGIAFMRMANKTVTEGGVAVQQVANDTATGVSMIDSAGAIKELINFGTIFGTGAIVTEFAGDSKTLALVQQGATYTFNLEDQQAAWHRPSSAHELAVCGSRVTWTDSAGEEGLGDHQYVYDAATKDYAVLDTPNNVGVGVCSGDSILWSSADGNGTTLVKW